MKKILLVDDSALMRSVLSDIINADSRFHVEDRAADGMEALEILKRKTYDAVVLDVNMPRMDGIQLLRELQKNQIAVKIMMASTDTVEGAKVTLDALELGAIDFIHNRTEQMHAGVKIFQRNLLRRLQQFVQVRFQNLQRRFLSVKCRLRRK